MCKTIHDNFETDKVQYDISYRGNEVAYPRYAREAFPILIEKAINREEPIGYAKLADQLCIEPYPSRDLHIGLYTLPCISTALYRLEQNTGEKLPRLTNIVFSYDNLSNPKNYIVKGWWKLYGSQLTGEDYRNELLVPIHTYEQWDQVFNQIRAMYQ